MERRDFIQSMVVVGATGGLGMGTQLAQAQSGGFKPSKETVPRSNPGKIDVIEFFWYGCPHCYKFEPLIQAWKKTLPSDVLFRQVPVGWPSKRTNFTGHQKLFYTLEAMGVLATAHSKVFEAMHNDKKVLADDAQIFDFAESIGLKRTEFANNFKSFGVNAKANQAVGLASAYGVDGVPSLGIDGKFLTSASLAGSDQDALRVADALIKRQRQG
ncbi:MAG: DsbA family protein [Limnobacter sp.]|nr:DsbA family protein [Limnobacter sp.]